jgi:hypothetical protein
LCECARQHKPGAESEGEQERFHGTNG